MREPPASRTRSVEDMPRGARSLALAEFRRHASIRSKYLAGLEDEFGDELAHCLDPAVHERRIRGYGAIVAREMPEVRHLGEIVDTSGMSLDVLRSCADGRKAVMLVVPGHPPRLLVFHERVDTDQDYAIRAAWIEGLIVANDESGVVRIITDASVTIVEGRRWMSKDLVFEATEEVLAVVPAANALVVRRILEICHHRVSPAKLGATFLCLLTDAADGPRDRDDGVDLRTLGLSVTRTADEPLILHQVKHRDGAAVVSASGRLLRVNVIMQPSATSSRVVSAYAGTRHTSAARHTFDRPDTLAFVVSVDGLVTVFSDGRKISELRMRDSTLGRDEAEATERSFETDCPSCGVSLAVRVVELPGPMAGLTATCPACERPAVELRCREIEAFMRKTPQSIDALLTLRQISGA